MKSVSRCLGGYEPAVRDQETWRQYDIIADCFVGNRDVSRRQREIDVWPRSAVNSSRSPPHRDRRGCVTSWDVFSIPDIYISGDDAQILPTKDVRRLFNY